MESTWVASAPTDRFPCSKESDSKFKQSKATKTASEHQEYHWSATLVRLQAMATATASRPRRHKQRGPTTAAFGRLEQLFYALSKCYIDVLLPCRPSRWDPAVSPRFRRVHLSKHSAKLHCSDYYKCCCSSSFCLYYASKSSRSSAVHPSIVCSCCTIRYSSAPAAAGPCRPLPASRSSTPARRGTDVPPQLP